MSELTSVPAASPNSATPSAAQVVADLQRSFRAGTTRPRSFRQNQLAAMKQMFLDNQESILDAIVADLGKPRFEALTTELTYLVSEIDYITKHLRKWMKPKRVKSSVVVQPATSKIYRDPLGVVLVIGPWNYPLQLAMGPAIAAISAGNCVVIKPSEVAGHTSAIIAELVPKYLDSSCIQVVEGGVPETTRLLEQKWDHIFYTGNGTVGRIVMTAAAQHLTPVTLELGGKSPAYVDRDVDLDIAARRLVWGKFTNAGQTCVAPDYILVHEDRHDALVAALSRTITEFYGTDPKQSQDYGRIINKRHFDRVQALMESGTTVAGGDVDKEEKYIAPTVLTDVSPDSPAMAEEIFGPVLPILRVSSVDEAIAFVNDRPKPLALYVFSKCQANAQRILQSTSSGGGCINHAWLHLAVPELPFGGVGESGMGAYHGRAGFETFTHHKSILDKSTLIDPSLMYPPYTDLKKSVIKRLV